MDLDRGTLARIDRKVHSRLRHEESYRAVRVPVSEVTWSTWKRYCDAVGISMGRAISTLIERELRTVINQGGEEPVFSAEIENRLGERQASLDNREHALKERERWLRENERRIRARIEPGRLSADIGKVGRNDRCPCGSGLKYKRCHGL